MTAQSTDLKALEKQAFSRFYEDGLFDLLLGLMMVALSFGVVIADWLDSELASLLAMLAVAVVLAGAFMFMRARVVRPRLGDFTPRAERRRRITATRLVLLGSFVLGMALFGIVGVAGVMGTPPTEVEVLLPVIWFVNATVVLGLMAYLLDVPRMFLYGVLFGLAGPLLIWPDVLWNVRVPPPMIFTVLAVPIVAIGAWKLVRFLQNYPVQEAPRSGADDGDR